MKTVNFVTLKAAHDVLARASKSVNLRDVQELVHANQRKPRHRHWSFSGDWKNSVAPYFHAK